MTVMVSWGKDLMGQTDTSTVGKNIVLVHGGFVDGSGWEGGYKALRKDGCTVAIVQTPTISLADDVAATKRANRYRRSSKDPPPGAPGPSILPPQDGYLFLDKAKFPAAFAADVSPDLASFMADSQVPWGVEALGGAITQPAWRTTPSWYLITTEDKMIPPDAQRAMSKRAGSTIV